MLPNTPGASLHSLTCKQHDAVLDYYGRRLATCSSDKTIKIFEVEGDSHRLVDTLKGYVPFYRDLSLLV